jgi:hypothetical protein
MACSEAATAPVEQVSYAKHVTTAATPVSTDVVSSTSGPFCVGDSREYQLVTTFDDGSTQVYKGASWSVGSPSVLNLRNRKSGNVTAIALGTSSIVAQVPAGSGYSFFVGIADVTC